MKHAWRKLPIGVAASFAIVLLLFPGVSRAQPAKPVWPMFGHDAAHTGRSPYRTGSEPGKLKWVFAVPFPTTSGLTGMQNVGPPAIGADGTLYAGVSGPWGGLYAVNPNGTQKWVFAPSLANGKKYGFINAPPAIGADGTIYLETDADNLDAVNPDGTLKWAFPISILSGLRSWPLQQAQGRLPARFTSATSDGTLYAINPAGTLKWKFAAGHVVGIAGIGTPAIGPDGTIYVCATNALRVNSRRRAQMDPYDPGQHTAEQPSVGADGTVYVGSGSWHGGHVTAVNPDGTLKWAFPTGGFVGHPIAIGADGTVYAASLDHNLYAIDPDGGLQWKFDTGDYLIAGPAIDADGTIFVSTNNGSLYAIGPDGRRKWTAPEGGQGALAIGADGTVYIGPGTIVAVGTETPPRGTSIWVSPVLSFGSEKVGGKKTKTIGIKNTGAAPLFIAGVTSSDSVEFRPGYSDCPAAGLSPNARCDIAVSFIPGTDGKHAATLTISGNAGTQTVSMSGSGR